MLFIFLPAGLEALNSLPQANVGIEAKDETERKIAGGTNSFLSQAFFFFNILYILTSFLFLPSTAPVSGNSFLYQLA